MSLARHECDRTIFPVVGRVIRSTFVRFPTGQGRRETGSGLATCITENFLFIQVGRALSEQTNLSKMFGLTDVLNQACRIPQQRLRCDFESSSDKGQFRFKRVRIKRDLCFFEEQL